MNFAREYNPSRRAWIRPVARKNEARINNKICPRSKRRNTSRKVDRGITEYVCDVWSADLYGRVKKARANTLMHRANYPRWIASMYVPRCIRNHATLTTLWKMLDNKFIASISFYGPFREANVTPGRWKLFTVRNSRAHFSLLYQNWEEIFLAYTRHFKSSNIFCSLWKNSRNLASPQSWNF